MANLFTLVFTLIVTTCSCIPIEYDEYVAIDSQPIVYSFNENDNSNQNDDWNSNDQGSAAAYETDSNVSGFSDDDISSLVDKSKSDETTVTLVKRDTEQSEMAKKFGLSDVIGNIEDSLLTSALQVSNLYKNLTEAKVNNATIAKNNATEIETNATTTTTTTTTERIKRETDAEYIASECADLAEAENITIENSASNSTENKTNTTKVSTVLSHVVAQDVPVTDDKAAHVVVNQLTVYLPQEAHSLPVLPSFGLTLNGEKHAAIKELENKTLSNFNASSLAENSSGESNESGESDEVTTIQSTSVVSDNLKSTDKTSVEELNDVEKKVKKEAAEVEAAPIILSTRL